MSTIRYDADLFQSLICDDNNLDTVSDFTDSGSDISEINFDDLKSKHAF